MDPVHIFYKEIKIDKDKIFTANIPQENEVENVLFNKDKVYVITGMVIKPDIIDSELIKIKGTKELDKISKEIQELTKNYEEPDLTLSIYNKETKTLLIPFLKKDESDLPKTKLIRALTKTNFFWFMTIMSI